MSKQIKHYPKWVQEIAIERIIEQEEVLDERDTIRRAIIFSDTIEDYEIWEEAENGNLQPLADFHNIKIDENGEEVVEGKEVGTKQQIKEAYNQGYRDGFLDAQSQSIGGKDIAEFNNAENYYNQTFKTE